MTNGGQIDNCKNGYPLSNTKSKFVKNRVYIYNCYNSDRFV